MKSNELIQSLHELLKYCRDKFPSYKSDAPLVPRDLAMFAVYDIILDIASDVLHCIELQHTFSTGILLRGLFDYQIELLYLAKDKKNFLERARGAYAELLKRIGYIEKSENTEIKNISSETWFKPNKMKLSSFTEGYKPKYIKSRCSDLGIKDDYESFYLHLCNYMHPNIKIITDHYYQVNPDNSLSQKPSFDIESEEVKGWLFLVGDIVDKTTKRFHEIIPKCEPEDIRQQLNKLASARYGFYDQPAPDNNI